MIANTNAVLLIRVRLALEEELFADILVWRVPAPVRGSAHAFKYRLALVDRGTCVLRYDNEAGKGDHKHVGETEVAYAFSTVKELQEDFAKDVALYRQRRKK